MPTYRGVEFIEVKAGEVQIGDRIVCMLSDAVASVEVTEITRHDYRSPELKGNGYYQFHYSHAPWWVDELDMRASYHQRVCGVFITPRSA